jgi:undecaprenyl phosphate-alpha-L-ara4N flippase subunit ArnF
MIEGHVTRILSNCYFQLALNIALITAAEIFVKIGAANASSSTFLPQLGAFDSVATWVGISLYIVALLVWSNVLRFMPLTKAYLFVSIEYAVVPAAAWLFLQETISITRGAGIGLVLAGVLLVASAAAKAGEEL